MKLSKVLLGSAFAVSTVAIPVTTLTSCGTTWGVLTPFSIGGTTVNDGPFSEFTDDFKDADNASILPYLQSNYSVDVKNGTNYAYATPMKWNDEAKEWNTPGSSGWYTSTDEAFASTHSYDDGDKTVTKTCAQNATLSANTDFVTTIGSTIKTYLEAALNYQGSQAKIVKKDGKDIGDDSNMKIAWGSEATNSFTLNHGTLMDKTNEQNAQFFEYVFANANMNSSGASKATFRTMSVAFQFEDMFLPTYDFTVGQRRLSEDFEGLIAGDDGQYWSEETEVDDPDIEGLKFKRQIYKSVPVIVRVTGIKQTYLNASNKKGSFLVSDYYSSSKDVSDSIKDSWKKTLPAFTNQDKDQAVPHYKSYEITTTSGAKITPKDERVGQVQGRDFIALVDYVVNDYTGTDHPEKTTAQISKLANFFPAYLLDLYPNDMYTTAAGEGTETIIDSSKVDEKTSELLQLLNRTSKEGMKAEAKDLNQESKNLLSFLGYMFAGTDKTINTTQVFKPKLL